MAINSLAPRINVAQARSQPWVWVTSGCLKETSIFEIIMTRYVSDTSEWSQVSRRGIVKNFRAIKTYIKALSGTIEDNAIVTKSHALYRTVILPINLRHLKVIAALQVVTLCAQLMRGLLAIAKFLVRPTTTRTAIVSRSIVFSSVSLWMYLFVITSTLTFWDKFLREQPGTSSKMSSFRYNIQDNVYGAVIMAEPLREFTRFIWWM